MLIYKEELQIGPFELPARLNGANYLEFLRNDLPGLLEDVDLERRRNLIYQQDGAPPHFSRAVRRHLDDTYQRNGWIGRAGPIAWPPRSPDLTPVDFWLWGHVKTLVYASDTTIRADCLGKIHDAFAEIKRSPDLIARATNDVARRFDLCQRLNGLHIEQYPHDM